MERGLGIAADLHGAWSLHDRHRLFRCPTRADSTVVQRTPWPVVWPPPFPSAGAAHHSCDMPDIELTTSDWPTIPQVYVKGEFVGGCDIMLSSKLSKSDGADPQCTRTENSRSSLSRRASRPSSRPSRRRSRFAHPSNVSYHALLYDLVPGNRATLFRSRCWCWLRNSSRAEAPASMLTERPLA